jgi:hypothetical protein
MLRENVCFTRGHPSCITRKFLYIAEWQISFRAPRPMTVSPPDSDRARHCGIKFS